MSVYELSIGLGSPDQYSLTHKHSKKNAGVTRPGMVMRFMSELLRLEHLNQLQLRV